MKYPQKFIHGRQNVKVSGDYIYESKNTINCFRIKGVEDGKFVQNILTGPVRDCYDFTNYGDNAELIYECLCLGTGVSNVKFSTQIYPNARNLTYCIFCNNSMDLFGCVGLRKKQYCIFNKQYTKKEYEELIPKIIQHMNDMPYIDINGSVYKYGEFLPSSFSPFSYQTTQAYEFFPLNEEEVKKQGFVFYEIKKQDYEITLNTENIPDNIKDVDKNIINKVIECAHKKDCKQECTGAFRIIEKEFDFCKRMNIPLPHLCPNCRHYERLLLRNAPKLCHRECMCENESHGHKGKCQNEFETSYSIDSKELVYCENCYNKEIY